MEAGITLGLTVGYQTDMLTYFLPLERGNGKTNKQVGHILSLFLLKCFLLGAERVFNNDTSFKKGGDTCETHEYGHTSQQNLSSSRLWMTSIVQIVPQQTFYLKADKGNYIQYL